MKAALSNLPVIYDLPNNISIEQVKERYFNRMEMIVESNPMFRLKDLYLEMAKDYFDRFNNEKLVVAYFYKPKTKYPERVYLFMDFLKWRTRNLRPMGLMNKLPFLTRNMTPWEVHDILNTNRMQYFQYESWPAVIQADLRVGVPNKYIHRLIDLQNAYQFRLDGRKYIPGSLINEQGQFELEFWK